MKSTSLTEGPISSHIRNITLPLSVGFFFNTMYNVVDSFYAGQVSTQALAAMALSFPVFFVIIALSQGVARGSSALIANAIGAGESDREEAYSGQVFSLGLLFSILITAAGLASAIPLFQLLGASGSYLDLANSYVRPLFWGSGFFLLSSMSNAILLAHGDSKTFSTVLIAGFFANLVLDPWFLHGGLGVPPMGLAGIAWATVIIQGLGGFYLFATVLRRGYIQMPKLLKRPQLRIYGEILH